MIRKNIQIAVVAIVMLFGFGLMSTPHKARAAQQPVSNLDVVNCSGFGGWSFDPDASSSSNHLDIYDYKTGSPVYVMSTDANGARGDVNAAFGISGNHGFTSALPASLSDGTNHPIVFYAIDLTGDGNPPISYGGSSTVNYNCAPPPPTITMSASPTTVAYGGSSTISWSSTNATSGCNVSGFGGTSGSFSTGALTNTTTYNGQCMGWGTASTSVTVTVASHVDLKANNSDGPVSITYNTGATLSWTSNNASSCSLYANGGATGWTGTSQASVATGNITSTVTYRVDCTGAGGNSSDTVVVNMNSFGSLDRANCTDMAGWGYDPDFPNTSTTVHIYKDGTFYTATNANGYRSDLPGNGNHAFGVATPNAWFDGVNHTIVAYAIDLNGGANSAIGSIVINCTNAPTVTMSASPNPVTYNSSSTVSWTTTSATSCNVNGNGGTSGSFVTPNLTTATTYNATCSGPGGSVNGSVTVNVNPPVAPSCTSTGHDRDWISGNTNNTAYAYGVANATSVLFPTWTTTNGQDDIIWYPGTQSGTTWSVVIPGSAHLDTGVTNVHIYMSNANYSNQLCGSASFNRVSNGTINVTSQDNTGNPARTNWTLTCTLTNPACPTYTGSGATSGTYNSAPGGSWTLTPANLPGYTWTVSPSQTQTGP